MSNLLARLLTAGLLIPFIILAIQWHNPLGVWSLVIAATAIGLREWMNMSNKEGPPVDRWFGVVMGTALAAAFYWLSDRAQLVPVLASFAVIATFLYFLFRYGAIETVAARVAFTVCGYFYVGLLTYLALLKKRPVGDGGAWIYISLTIAWLSDTGAYFAGRFIGPLWPRKLYESVSPKKTVIGFFGGIGGSFLGLVIAKFWYLRPLTWIDCALIALPANLLGQMGDLCESLVKRSVGVKDSGALLPGHGGMLDRIDALLFVLPYVYCYSEWIYGRL
jgi:phosphatidate cytidylyltransferase